MDKTPDHRLGSEPRSGVEAFAPFIPAIRLVVGLGDPDRERLLLPALGRDGRIVVVQRCLSADQLVASVRSARIDAVLLADDLHRLTDDALATLRRSRVALVRLASRPAGYLPGVTDEEVLPLDAAPDDVREAILAACQGERWHPAEPEETDRNATPEDERVSDVPMTDLRVVAVASGHGSPGRSLVALNLAVALGAVAPTILVDADVSGPSLAAYLDLDPTRSLFMLAHADPRTPHDWDRAVAAEVQPFCSRCPDRVVLAGIPKPEMRAGVTPAFFDRLLAELRRRYRYVLVDVGADLLTDDLVLHRLALGASDRVLFVASADLVGLWHARVGLGVLTRTLDLDVSRIALVINRHQRRFHHRRSEIEWALGHPSAAIIPDDSFRIQKAMLGQTPIVLNQRSPAGRSLLDLAERINGGSILLPPESSSQRTSGWFGRVRFPNPRRLAWNRSTKEGKLHGHDATATS